MNDDQQTTRDQAAHIAALVHAGRPDWGEPGILAALAKRKHVAPVTLAIAALRWSLNPDATTPAGIALDGPHWRIPETTASQAERHPSSVKLGDLCPECFRHTCDCDPKRSEARRRVNAPQATARGAAMARDELLRARREAAHGPEAG